MPTFDPRLSLASALQSQPGVYALLIGSGVSTGAGIPTGWGVVEALVRKAAVASGAAVGEDFDAATWWAANGEGELGYSSVLEQLGSTPGARRALLANFFEPTDDDRDNSLKVPGKAHKAIATLVRKGVIRVIVTTNFDRLLERALEAEGISPQIIQSDAQIAGMEPPQHMACTIIKLHGDYAGLDQRNTVDELSSYLPATTELLDRVLKEYGLIVSGWSGEWDTALVASIAANSNRRYPLYWVARSTLGEVAQRLTARSGAHVIQGQTADEFFPDMVSRVEALESMTDSPDSINMALARLKKALPDPVRHIEVRDLFEGELAKLSAYGRQVGTQVAPADWDAFQAGLNDLIQRTETLLRLFTTGILLDRDRQHTDLWVRVIQQAMALRKAETYNHWWDRYLQYPALLLLRAGTIAALDAGHEDVARRLLFDPTWSSPYIDSSVLRPAWLVLHPWNVTHHDQIKNLPRWDGAEYTWLASRMIREDLAETIALIAPEDDYEMLYFRAEYRAALAWKLAPGTFYRQNRPISGEYLGEHQWTYDNPQIPAVGKDFEEHGDRPTWGRAGGEESQFDAQIEELYETLRGMRREW